MVGFMSKQLYFIAVLPPDPLRTRVKELKQEMQLRFAAGHALKSPAHITLQMPFRLEKDRQDALCDLLQAFAGRQEAFSVNLNGFDCFPPGVLFIRIEDHKPLIPLQASLKTALVDAGVIPDRAAEHPFHPHMTIATRDLSREAFEIAWPEYRERDFSGTFRVQSLVLLKHNGRHWEVLKEFGFVPR